MADLLNWRTASQYTPMNEVLQKLAREAMPAEERDHSSGERTKKNGFVRD
jgi:hypothetical protein